VAIFLLSPFSVNDSYYGSDGGLISQHFVHCWEIRAIFVLNILCFAELRRKILPVQITAQTRNHIWASCIHGGLFFQRRTLTLNILYDNIFKNVLFLHHDHFLKNISWVPTEVSSVPLFWNSTFLFFKILIANQDMSVFQYFYVSMMHFYFCIYPYVFFFCKALGLLNPNLFKFLRYTTGSQDIAKELNFF
jgi:hypothetical protein